MTNEELLSVAEIVERLATRFHEQAADHERQLAEHRAAFGARTEADAKIIARLEGECNVLRPLVVDAAKYKAERDDLLTQVQDMRAEMERVREERDQFRNSLGDMLEGEGYQRVVKERDGLLTQVQDMRAERERLRSENQIMRNDAEDGYAEAIKVLGDPIALSKERDALRAEVAALQERLRASIARGDFAQMEVAALKSRTPKHPVKVGEWVERTSGEYSPRTKIGAIAQVIGIDEDGDYEVSIDGTECYWSPKYCIPCDPPTEATHDTPTGKQAAEAAVKTEPDEIKVGDVVEVFQATCTVRRVAGVSRGDF